MPRFHKRRSFTAHLTDSRGIRAELQAQIRDSGERLIGTWKDDLGNTGLFSLEKTSAQTQ